MAKLSVIITAYQRDDITVAHVRNSMDVSRVPDEIIVVNDGGDDCLRDKIKALPRSCKIIYARIHENIEWNYNGACNLAVWLSRGDLLAFEDNDNIPSHTFYEEVIEAADRLPNVSRFQASKRHVVSLEDFTTKPKSEWEVIGYEGANMGTAVIPRRVYLEMKGHDERFCGGYGLMYTDWRSRGMRTYGKENYTASVGYYFYTKQGQTDLSREQRAHNRWVYKDNAHHERTQHPDGILNFTYDYEILS